MSANKGIKKRPAGSARKPKSAARSKTQHDGTQDRVSEPTETVATVLQPEPAEFHRDAIERSDGEVPSAPSAKANIAEEETIVEEASPRDEGPTGAGKIEPQSDEIPPASAQRTVQSTEIPADLSDLREVPDIPLPRPSGRSLSTAPSRASEEPEPNRLDTARELLSSQYYLRQWGRMGMRNRSEQVDDFGYDPVYDAKVAPFFHFLYERYFRVDATGLEQIPESGPCLLVSNHSGMLSLDGLMLKIAIQKHLPKKRELRWLAEDFVFHFPFLGSFSNRVGAVRACQENAERLLRAGALVGVFPEGVKGIGKLYKERYRLQRFGRGGYIKLALRAGVPVIPVAIVGAEEMNPMLHRFELLNKALGVPYIPITPTFPWLGPLGLVPAPTKWRIRIGEPIVLGHTPLQAEDELLVGRISERVRSTIQGMVDQLVGERRSVILG